MDFILKKDEGCGKRNTYFPLFNVDPSLSNYFYLNVHPDDMASHAAALRYVDGALEDCSMDERTRGGYFLLSVVRITEPATREWLPIHVSHPAVDTSRINIFYYKYPVAKTKDNNHELLASDYDGTFKEYSDKEKSRR